MVRKIRQAFASQDSVQFSLCLSYHMRVESHSQEENLQDRCCLPSTKSQHLNKLVSLFPSRSPLPLVMEELKSLQFTRAAEVLTGVHTGGCRSNYTFIKPLILRFKCTVETGPSDRGVTGPTGLMGIITVVNLWVEKRHLASSPSLTPSRTRAVRPQLLRTSHEPPLRRCGTLRLGTTQERTTIVEIVSWTGRCFENIVRHTYGYCVHKECAWNCGNFRGFCRSC